MDVSEDFFLFFWCEIADSVQNAIVFISKIIHIVSQEFVIRHRGGVRRRNVTIKGVVEILALSSIFNLRWIITAITLNFKVLLRFLAPY